MDSSEESWTYFGAVVGFVIRCWVEILVGGILLGTTLKRLLARRREERMQEKVVPCKTMIILGSGGHTSEILTVVEGLDPKLYSPRVYILAETDILSLLKLTRLERGRGCTEEDYTFTSVKRVREVGESWFVTLSKIPMAMKEAYHHLKEIRPNLILCNGPGICVPFCIVASFFWNFGVWDGRSVYIESFCRTKTLSVSGKILYYFVDIFTVQWEALLQRYNAPHVVSMGRVS